MVRQDIEVCGAVCNGAVRGRKTALGLRGWVTWVLFLSAASGCSMQKLAIRQMTPMLPEGIIAFEEEPDYQFAREALGGQIKFLETLYRNDPDNLELRILLSRGYSSYGFLFLEEDARSLEFEEPDLADVEFARARNFYLRARNYCLEALAARKGFKSALNAGIGDEGLQTFERHLKKYGPKDVPILFWTAYAWGAYVNLSRDDIDILADAPKADALMKRVLELDPDYYNGGAHLYFAVLNGVKPESLGGKPQVALKHFEAARRIAKGKFLLTDVFWARYYGVQTQNRELYVSKLEAVLEAPDDLFPQQALANVLAKKRARRLLDNVDEYFF